MIDGIYTGYMTGIGGQGMAMFVFKERRIAGADMAGLTFVGEYVEESGRVRGSIKYQMPAGSASITGAVFENESSSIEVALDLPSNIDPEETYRLETPTGAVNAKFVKNVAL